MPFGERPPLARCWLLAGGPRLGNGPVEGTRREDAALGGGPRCGTAGRDGGGINPADGLGGGGPDTEAGLGGGGISEVFCALLAAGKVGVGLCRSLDLLSSLPPASSMNVGTGAAPVAGFALGVPSSSDCVSSSGSGSFISTLPWEGCPVASSWEFDSVFEEFSSRHVPGKSHCGNKFHDIAFLCVNKNMQDNARTRARPRYPIERMSTVAKDISIASTALKLCHSGAHFLCVSLSCHVCATS